MGAIRHLPAGADLLADGWKAAPVSHRGGTRRNKGGGPSPTALPLALRSDQFFDFFLDFFLDFFPDFFPDF